MADPFDPRNVSVGYAAESTFGVTPTGSGIVQKIPFQSWSLKQPTDTVISQTIRGRRAPIDLLRTSIRGEATVGFELIHTAYDSFLEMALMSAAWSSVVTATDTTFSLAASDDSINDSGGGFGSYVANQWIHISGFTGTTQDQNGFRKILTASASKITFAPGITSDDAAGESVTVVQGGYLEDSNVFRSYVLEAQFDESTDMFQVGNGMAVNEMNMTIAVGEIINGSFGFLGSQAATSATAVDASPLAATSNRPMTAVDHVVAVQELSALSDLEILGMEFSTNNNLATREIVGTLGAAKKHRADLFEAAGTARIYLTGDTHLDYFYNFDTHNIATTIQDSAGNAYVIDFPAVKFSDADLPVQGGQDNVVELPFNAFEHPTELIAMRVARFLSLP